MISNVFDFELIFLMFLLVLPTDELAFGEANEAIFMRVDSLENCSCSLDTFAPVFAFVPCVGAVAPKFILILAFEPGPEFSLS